MLDKQCKYHLSKIHKVLNNPEYEFLIGIIPDNWNMEGMTNGDQVILDPRGQLIPTVIHECLHLAYPKWDEEKVSQIEKKLTQGLSAKQWHILIFKIALRI